MLSKRQSKYFKSLQLKKYRQLEGKFLVEGAKGVEEVLRSSYQVESLLGTAEFLNSLSESVKARANEVIEAKEADLLQVGTFKTNKAGVAVVKIPVQSQLSADKNGLILALDGINDPGNLGTIIRIADWYGINNIICSEDTADVYNPKVINSTMGSFTRVNVSYGKLKEFIATSDCRVYGALLEGQSIYKSDLKPGIVLMGSESHGISEELRKLITDPIKIPGRGGAESLNVGVATAVVLDNFFRN